MNNERTPGALGSNDVLAGCYTELASVWMWAAREYAARAVKAERFCVTKPGDTSWDWNVAAIRASQRAARYARLAKESA